MRKWFLANKRMTDYFYFLLRFVGINASDVNFVAGRYDPTKKPPFDCGFEVNNFAVYVCYIVIPGRRTTLVEYDDCILCRGVRTLLCSPKMRCSVYDIKLHLMVKLLFWIFGEYGVSHHCYFSQVHSDPVLVSVSLPFMGQIDLFENYSYLIGQYAKKKLHLHCFIGLA